MSRTIIPHLWFDREAQEAADFYVSLFENSAVGPVGYYGKAGAGVSGMPEGSVMTVQFTLAGTHFAAINGGPVFTFTPSISLFVVCDTPAGVDRLYHALADGGSVLMPLAAYPFSERYAWLNDRYGFSWQLYAGTGPQRISPCLMFTGKHYCRTMEAINRYGEVFGASPVDRLTYYGAAEGERDGAVKHAEFTVGNLRFMAMDSGFDHKFSFTPAFSFMVACRSQEEIDRLWESLSAVPEAEACGWLQDEFGISWQIVPEELGAIMNVDDPATSERVMASMYAMKKPDIAALKRAAA